MIDKARTEGLKATRAAVQNKLIEETAVGYSSAGTIIEVGPEAVGFTVGDRVACCGGGNANHAEICAMPRNQMALVPESVPLATASLATIGAIALHGVRLAEPELGERVAVIGSGLVGQIACRLLRAQGAEVFALDVDAGRVDYAVSHGADHGIVVGDSTKDEIRELTNGHGIDRVVVTAASGSPEPLVLGAEIARDRGSMVLVGAVPIEIPRAPLYEKEISFRVSRSYGPGRYDPDYEERGNDYPIGYVRWTEQRNLEAVLDLQARGLINLDDLVDEVVPVDEAERAYSRLVADDHSERPLGAIVLEYEDTEVPEEEPQLTQAVLPPESTQVVPVTGPVRIGLIGPGSFASRILLPAFVDSGAILEVVGGGSGPSAESAVRQKGFSRFAPSAASVCQDEGVDAVVIATRHDSHAEYARSALDSGKHVFCEKPLATDVAGLDSVMEAASGSGRILAVGFNRRFAPMVRQLQGHIRQVPGPITATFRVSAGLLPPDHWTHDIEIGGGRIVGEGCHFIDVLRFVVGEPIESVYAAGHGHPENPVKAKDRVSLTLSFADGSSGQVTYAGQGSPKVSKERLEVFGNGGLSAIMDDYGSLELYSGSQVKRSSAKTKDKGHAEEIASFVAAVKGEGDPVPLEEIGNVSYATLAAVRSLETGRPVRVPPFG
ncbi:MAG: bi-domain-containing oxidoreductase [Solirubrobacterales bacterium]|nr:bi-domain-containing oxidoreductase [Solirubrobacterales bacterium]